DENAVEVGFAGLYDTVLSYMASQLFKSANNKLQQTAHKYANKVLHLAAAEEHRKDFPLHNIKASKSKGGEEYYLPGVHSDVGGSYNKADEGKIKKETDPAKKEALLVFRNKEELTINQGQLWEMEADKQWLDTQGWYKGKKDNRTVSMIKSDAKATIKELEKKRKFKLELRDGDFTINLYFHPRQSNSYDPSVYFAYATLSVSRVDIHSAFSSIPLKVMADYVKNEPKLMIKKELEDRANSVIDVSNLGDLEKKVLGYIGKKPANSKAEDWIGEGEELNNFLKNYRNKHLNFSASKGPGYAPKIEDGKRTRFIYDA
uniref:phospholipase effector Tle1 domain-containing protein n=1 Tax=Psychromonas sp. Urea-02u-13 TaxID=2058326 RepID=UPI000CA746EE